MMETCQFCGEELRSSSNRCPSCNRIQYRYATDEGTDEAIARTDASDAAQSRIDDLYGDKDELLEELGEMIAGASNRPTPPPTTPPRMARPTEPARSETYRSQPPSRARTEHSQEPAPVPASPDARKAVGCLTTFFILGVLGFWFFLIIGVAQDPADWKGAFQGGIIMTFIPILIIARVLRRRNQRR